MAEQEQILGESRRNWNSQQHHIPKSSNWWCCGECHPWYCEKCSDYHCNWFESKCRKENGVITIVDPIPLDKWPECELCDQPYYPPKWPITTVENVEFKLCGMCLSHVAKELIEEMDITTLRLICEDLKDKLTSDDPDE